MENVVSKPASLKKNRQRKKLGEALKKNLARRKRQPAPPEKEDKPA